MADHTYKMSEVPKDKRKQQFKDYYLWPTIIGIGIIIIVVSILKNTVFSPDPDVQMLCVTSQYVQQEQWNRIGDKLEAAGVDYDQDKESIVQMESIFYNEAMQEEDPQMFIATQTKLIGDLSSPNYTIMICDDTMFHFLLQQNVVGTYHDLAGTGLEGQEDEYVKIPLKQMAMFTEEAAEMPDLYVTIRSKEASRLTSDKKIEQYNHQLDALVKMVRGQ